MRKFSKLWRSLDIQDKLNVWITIACLYCLSYTVNWEFTFRSRPETEFVPFGFFKILPGPLSVEQGTQLSYFWIPGLLCLLIGIGRNLFSKIVFFLSMFAFGYHFVHIGILHGHHAFVMSLALLSLTQLNRYSNWHWLNPLTPQQFFNTTKCYMVYIWFLTGLQKIYYGGVEWVTSDNLANTVFLLPTSNPVNDYLLAQHPWFFKCLAFGGLSMEILAPLIFFSRRLSLLFPFKWIIFHILVTLLMGGHYRFFSQIVLYTLFWLDPEPLLKKESLRSIFLKTS